MRVAVPGPRTIGHSPAATRTRMSDGTPAVWGQARGRRSEGRAFRLVTGVAVLARCRDDLWQLVRPLVDEVIGGQDRLQRSSHTTVMHRAAQLRGCRIDDQLF